MAIRNIPNGGGGSSSSSSGGGGPITLPPVTVETGTFTLSVVNGSNEAIIRQFLHSVYGVGFIRSFKIDLTNLFLNGDIDLTLTFSLYEKIDGITYTHRNSDGYVLIIHQADNTPNILDIPEIYFSHDIKVTAALEHPPLIDLILPYRIELYKNQ